MIYSSVIVFVFGLVASGSRASQANAQAHAQTHAQAPIAVSIRTQGEVRLAAAKAIRDFIGEWRLAWRTSDSLRASNGSYSGSQDIRAVYTHCHSRRGNPDHYTQGLDDPEATPILPPSGRFAKCPSWRLGVFGSEYEETDNIDAHLTQVARTRVREARRRLLLTLDSARLRSPLDPWLVGQRVRFQVDQGLTERSFETAAECRVDRWWCNVLTAYVRGSAGDVSGAQSAFAEATGALPDSLRCGWTDIRVLLPENHRSKYKAPSCSVRDSLAEVYWWLSDPLFSEPVNERRVEHFMRKTTILLRSALEIDEHYTWPSARGGEAIAEMLLRYGWPSAAVWAGNPTDRTHDGWLVAGGTRHAAPYSTAEYNAGRLAFTPSWPAANSPFTIDDAAYELTPPHGFRDSMTGPGKLWWPTEHMRWRGRRITTLPAGQWGMFRRQHHVRLAATIDSEMSDSSITRLMLSSGPDSMRNAVEQILGPTSRLQFETTLGHESLVASVESQSMRLPHFARTRRGLVPPSALHMLARDSIAISDPVLFSIAGATLPSHVDAMLPLMLGKTTISRDTKVGVFWEAYGIRAGDSVRVAVSVVPLDDPGLLRRLGSALRLVSAPTEGIAVSWADPRATSTAGADVPILPRALALDLSKIPAGRYALDVAVSTPSRAAVRSRREFTLR